MAWFVNLRNTILRNRQNASSVGVPKRPKDHVAPLRPARWFWLAVFIGLAIRIYLVVFTQGTYDVEIKQQHAEGIAKLGLMNYYHANSEMNHPPFAATVFSWLLTVTKTTGIPFRILFRAPFAIMDAGTAFLLLLTFPVTRYRFAVTACYWLCPLTMICSSYHGNTDSSVAFFLMLSLYLLSKERTIWAAVPLGLSLWVKLPAVLALPAFFFYIKRWQFRLCFLLTVGIVGIFTYLPAVFCDPAILVNNVFAYRGQFIYTTAGMPVWGTGIFLPYLTALPLQWQQALHDPIVFLCYTHNTRFCILLIVVFCWLRRSEESIFGLGRTIAGVYVILYGFTNLWSFQYFAWSIPFWLWGGACFAFPALLLASAYIYGLYWFLCGNPWLLGRWDFAGHPYWPQSVILMRDLTVLLFFLSAMVFIMASVKRHLLTRKCGQKESRRIRA